MNETLFPEPPVDPLFFERQARQRGYRWIAGIDEAGRGPLAGPVVAAAVVLPECCHLPGLTDSKQLSEKERERLFPLIRAEALAVGIGWASAAEVDQLNVLQATLRSMVRAFQRLQCEVDYLLVDGISRIPLSIPQATLKQGDSRSLSISAASVVAKVVRDRLMCVYDRRYPDYGFARHKGYGSAAHLRAIAQFGPSPCIVKHFAACASICRMTEERLKLGAWGEDQAVAYLRRKGLKIVARNLRTPVGEVDIIARDRRHLLFVEVKTRRSIVCGLPAEAVGFNKQRQILRTAQWYLLQGHGRGLQPRFDVVSVLACSDPPQIEHIENAFGLDGS